MCAQKGTIQVFYGETGKRLSVTGCGCDMECPHCKGTLLEGSADVSAPGVISERIFLANQNGLGSVIVTGGRDLAGALPVDRYIEGMSQVSSCGTKIVVRPGLVSDDVIARLKESGVSAFSFDVHQDQEIIGCVLNLESTAEDYARVLDSMIATGLPVIPRITLGFGRIDFEFSVELLVSRGLKKVILDTIVPDERTCIDESVVRTESYLECARYIMDRGLEVCVGTRTDPSMTDLHVRAAELGIRNFEEISFRISNELEKAGYLYRLHTCHFGLE